MTVRDAAVDSALEKWRGRLPEWAFAEPFLAPLHRERAAAWFALRDELTHAAWGGTDPRPGEAKLAWWAEELQGWTRGVRRHPLGIVLQREPAAWHALAATLPSLIASRERASSEDEAFAKLEPFAEGVSTIASTLFSGGEPAPTRSVVAALLAKRVISEGDAMPPLQCIAKAGGNADPSAASRLWAGRLLEVWPLPFGGSVAGRLHASLVHERLRRFAKGTGPADRPLPGWRALLTSWRAARR
jgi:hypothetical protein